MPFDQIIEAVQKGEVDAGLLIHEGQLFYNQMGLNKVLDLGEWWYEKTGLPLPMGGNVIRRDLGKDLMQRVSKYLHQSIVYSMENREDALAYAMQFARDMQPGACGPFCRDVGQRPHARLWRSRPRSRQTPPGRGPQGRHHPEQGQGGFRGLAFFSRCI